MRQDGIRSSVAHTFDRYTGALVLGAALGFGVAVLCHRRGVPNEADYPNLLYFTLMTFVGLGLGVTLRDRIGLTVLGLAAAQTVVGFAYAFASDDGLGGLFIPYFAFGALVTYLLAKILVSMRRWGDSEDL